MAEQTDSVLNNKLKRQVFLLARARPNLLSSEPRRPVIVKHSIARVQREILPSENQFSLEYSKGSSPSRAVFLKYFTWSPAILAEELFKKTHF